MIEQKFLPIGSVCILKGATRRVMVTGFLAKGDSSEKTYDYVGCMYPEGVLNSNQNLLFDHDQIEKIFALGFSDDSEKEFKNKLNAYLKNNSDTNNENLSSEVVGSPSTTNPTNSEQVNEISDSELEQTTLVTPNSNISPFNILPDIETIETIE